MTCTYKFPFDKKKTQWLYITNKDEGHNCNGLVQEICGQIASRLQASAFGVVWKIQGQYFSFSLKLHSNINILLIHLTFVYKKKLSCIKRPLGKNCKVSELQRPISLQLCYFYHGWYFWLPKCDDPNFFAHQTFQSIQSSLCIFFMLLLSVIVRELLFR